MRTEQIAQKRTGHLARGGLGAIPEKPSGIPPRPPHRPQRHAAARMDVSHQRSQLGLVPGPTARELIWPHGAVGLPPTQWSCGGGGPPCSLRSICRSCCSADLLFYLGLAPLQPCIPTCPSSAAAAPQTHSWSLPNHGCQTQLPLSCPVAHGGWQGRTVPRYAVARTPRAASIHLEGARCILSACTAPMMMAAAAAAARRHKRADAGPA
eukprot:COSAG01_NODE_70_length_28755_cov_34.709067_7_plen_209_part_00